MPTPPAYMGFVGFVRFSNADHPNYDSVTGQVIRATSADIALKQEITKPDVVDSRYDRSLYQLGPQIIEGNISFPAVYGTVTGQGNVFAATYYYAVARDATSGLLSKLDFDIKYAENEDPNISAFVFEDNILDTWQFSVTAEEVVNITIGVIGTTRKRASAVETIPPSQTLLSNSRVVTWNDALVTLLAGTSSGYLSTEIGSSYVRSFECNVNNNSQRFYTLNGLLSPQDIAPTKRDITGTVTLMGRHDALGQAAVDNDKYCYIDTSIKFGYESNVVQSGCAGKFIVTIPNIVYEIEEISLSNELFESTVNWHALPNAGTGVNDPMLSSVET